MKNILCLTDSLDDIQNFVKRAHLFFFQIEQLEPEEHSFLFFEEVYRKLKESTDLSQIDVVIAEYVEAVPLIYFMRKEGYFCPTIFIPHTNAYPFNILFYFLLVSHLCHQDDLILCGSVQAAKGYQQLVRIKALPICTFGIKPIEQIGSKYLAREKLGLAQKGKILLYTGRFMNDKGLMPLFEIYEHIKKRIDGISLVLSVNHIDPDYYNQIAPRMRDTTLFYRLKRREMGLLYQSADLFVSAATSIFETYGKSPLEAISCGVPAILPYWDGFPYFITPENGSLAKVHYRDFTEEVPYSFATVDIDDFANKCCEWLLKQGPANRLLPEWAYYDHTMMTLSKMIDDLAFTSKKFYQEVAGTIPLSHYPDIIQSICSYYSIQSCEDIEVGAEQLGLINRQDPGELNLLKELHHELFKTMDHAPDHIFQQEASICTPF